MANSSAHRPPADLPLNCRPQQQIHPQQQLQQAHVASTQHDHYLNQLHQKNGPASSSPGQTKAPAATSKPPRLGGGGAPPVPELVRPHFKGHQRRQSVARLLPDIGKLRLLSWLVEASNELINCDIAIMDGVYAKLNRSRESLLFWQQSQQQAGASSRAPPRPPMLPAVQPVGNKSVILKRHKQPDRNSASSSLSSSTASQHQQQQQQQQQQRLVSARNKLFGQKLFFSGTAPPATGAKSRSDALSASDSRNHHSLPTANCDSSSLAAVSLRSSLCTADSQLNDADSIAGSIQTTQSTASDSIEAAIEMMMRQQRKRSALKAAAVANQPTTRPGARNNCSLPNRLPNSSVDFGDVSSNVHSDGDENEDEEEEDDDDDGNSSAASSTTSSGIHGASSASSSSSAGSSSSSSSASSSVDSSCSLDETNHLAHRAQTPATTAEQLSERIRRAVVEHNYLQNLLVNVIRHHDRQRDRQQQELAALRGRQPVKLDAFGRPSQTGGAAADELPRIDLARIAEAIDDGCQCSCHNLRRQQVRADGSPEGPPPRPPPPSTSAGKASTLPGGSSLSLLQTGTSLVASRKNRRKKRSAAEPPSREDLIQQLSGKLCENCFETHYWLQGCVAIETPNDAGAATSEQAAEQLNQQKQTTTTTAETSDLKAVQSGAPTDTHDQHQAINTAGGVGSPLVGSLASEATTRATRANLDSIISLRNATFIRLVQQQVRATISNSIELIDLIRREIKSPESIKQKQLMRCFSASIQLLSSVAGYVVPSQDISTFIPPEMVSGGAGGLTSGGGGAKFASTINSQQQQQSPSGNATTLFTLPPSDFDHLLLYPHQQHNQLRHPNAIACEPFLPGQGNRGHQQNQANNYHLAQAPEIPLRRRNLWPSAQRRSLDETHSTSGGNPLQHPRVHLLGHTEQQAGSRTSLTADITTKVNSDDDTNPAKRLSSETLVAHSTTATITNPNGELADSSSGASSNNSSASSSIARGQIQQSSLKTGSDIDDRASSHDPTSAKFRPAASVSQRHNDDNNHQSHHYLHQHHIHHQNAPQRDIDELALFQQSGRAKFWQSSKFNFIKKLLQVKQQRLLRQQSKDRRNYNNKVANKFRLVMMDLIHFNKSQQLLTTENGVNSLLTSMRNVLEFGLYLTVKLY